METRKQIHQKNKETKKLKKGHEPWPEQEKVRMQLGVNQIIQNRDKERQELMTEKTGLNEMEKEIQVNIDVAALKVKAANMELASLLFDQKFEITIHKHKNRVIELEYEIANKNHNIEVFQKQLDEGRPKKKTVNETACVDSHGKSLRKKQKNPRDKPVKDPNTRKEEGTKEQTCMECGCTEMECSQCIEKTGQPCSWVAPNKCSACFDKHGIPLSEKQ